MSHFNHMRLIDSKRCLLLFIWLRNWWMKGLEDRELDFHTGNIHLNLVYNLQHYMTLFSVLFVMLAEEANSTIDLCCTACGPPSEGLVTKQIRQDIYRCEKMHSSNTVWNSSVKCALSNKPVYNEMRETVRETHTQRENPRSKLSCFLAQYFKRSWGVAEHKS